eukprot:9252845-Pyramimonas_sp.AAC.1
MRRRRGRWVRYRPAAAWDRSPMRCSRCRSQLLRFCVGRGSQADARLAAVASVFIVETALELPLIR